MKNHRLKIITALFCLSFLCLSSSIVAAQGLTTINWHSSVQTGTIFGWKVTSSSLVNASDPFVLGGQIVELNDVLQFKYIANPPTDASVMFNTNDAPSWMQLYVNGDIVDYSLMGDEGTAFKLYILPILFTFDNASTFNLSEVHKLGQPYDAEGYYDVNATHVNVTFVAEELELTYIFNLDTGISGYVSADIYETGSFVMEYFDEAANVDEEGVTHTIATEYTEFRGGSPIANLELYLVAGGIGALLIIVIILRRR